MQWILNISFACLQLAASWTFVRCHSFVVTCLWIQYSSYFGVKLANYCFFVLYKPLPNIAISFQNITVLVILLWSITNQLWHQVSLVKLRGFVIFVYIKSLCYSKHFWNMSHSCVIVLRIIDQFTEVFLHPL